ncbi:Phenylalanine--tRNA ligase alpha subunit [Pirellulimonas nuda]|uniref:Phenylalanine--tRNA ligase alpha subunit n=1 Tax=Pirellulimonas nuda TaxID=2528009 RepID=A0A518DGD1_9BACT|nr:phenylalanine--tRNA ligase subunit alpha [Pirellulimonas nuda]QDU90531.1 Phenylalanine--tRNA ligase alpha subunit [Pirellulimonas nuda]
MSLEQFVADLDAFADEAVRALSGATDQAAVESARVAYLGAKAGRLKDLQKGMGAVDKGDKPAAGKKLNEVKAAVEAALDAAQTRLASSSTGPRDDGFDVTLPGVPLRLGRLHPITQTIERMKEIMGRLGFSAVEGPEIEDDWHNFEALNIPLSHPARDPLDNFYLQQQEGREARGEGREARDEGRASASSSPSPLAPNPSLLLRSQTSTVQIRVMENTPPPVRIISLGRVYRPDTADATHYPMFHQIEGLLIDRGVTMADLKSTLRMFCQSFFGAGSRETGEDLHIRFRPSFFPFTEPSVEVDMNWQDGWMEMGGAGMVDPNVLKAVGYDPEEVTGFAFGLGVERICMRQHNIRDIRDLYTNDVRFLGQF